MEIKDFKTLQKELRTRRINAILNYKDYSESQKNTLNKFYAYLQRKGLRDESVRAYLQNLKLLFKETNKDVTELTKEDIDQYLISLNNRFKSKTIQERRKFLILIFEWVYSKEKEKIDLIKDIRLDKNKDSKLPEELLSTEEIKKMVQVAENFRDKAIIVLLYETAARKGEFLQLKIKHVDIINESHGMITIPKGKTVSRRIPIIYSLPYVKELINSHPKRDDPNAPLFVTYGSWLGKAIGEDALKLIVKKIGKRAGIKKRIYPHIFRHSRLTELGKELKEQELNKFAGWVSGSSMARVYVHLSGEDVSNKILANAGLIDEAEIKNGKNVLQAIKCPRCDKVNPFDVKHCDCGFILDLKEVNKLLEKKKQSKEMLSDFLDPESVQRLFKTVYKLEKEMNQLRKDKL